MGAKQAEPRCAWAHGGHCVQDPRVRLSANAVRCRALETIERDGCALSYGRWRREGDGVVDDMEGRPPPHAYRMLAFGITDQRQPTSSLGSQRAQEVFLGSQRAHLAANKLRRERKFRRAQLVAEMLGVLELAWRAEGCAAFLGGGGECCLFDWGFPRQCLFWARG